MPKKIKSNQINLNSFQQPASVASGTGTISGSSTLTTTSYNVIAGRSYLILGNIQQFTPTGTASVWEVAITINGAGLSTTRRESPTGTPQTGLQTFGVYGASTTGSVTVAIYASRLTGTASVNYEFPTISIVPLPYST